MRTASTTTSTWFRRFHPSPAARMRLVCFPHAGGSASAYFALSAALGPGIEVVAVQYPGRQDRFRDEPVPDIRELAQLVVTALAAEPSGAPTALFGHSMGALVAFEAARLLTDGPDRPRTLFASGRRAPDGAPALAGALDDESIVAELRRLAGTDGDLLADEALLPMILPAIRSDFRAVQDYVYRPGELLHCPIEVLTGDSDPMVTVDEASQWARHTTGPCSVQVFEGGHFYLEPRLPAVADLLRTRLLD